MKNKHVENMPAQPPSQQKKKAKEEAEVTQLIVFNLGDEEYGANINQIREIIRTGTITPIPDSPDFVKGVSNIRGEIPVIIDLKARFYLPHKEREIEDKHIVITEQENNVFGLLVDEVTEVLRIPETQIKPAPGLVVQIDREYVSGVITLDERLIIMLDLSKVLSYEELSHLTEFYQKHRRFEEKPHAKSQHVEVSPETENKAEETAQKAEAAQLV